MPRTSQFSFLDHALRCGDSLVGLTSEEQIETFRLDPARGRFINARLSGAIDEIIGPLLTRVQELREEIEAEPIRDARHGEELARKLREAERLADRLRLAADAVCAAALSAAGDAKRERPALYRLVHDQLVQDQDIARLRGIHVEVDEAVREAYALDEEREPEIREFEAKIASAPLPAWWEIDLGHGFHETRQGVRFTISPQAQTDMLDKLLALNHYRHRQEQEQGLTRKKRRGARAKPAAVPGAETTLPIEDALIPRDDTLF